MRCLVALILTVLIVTPEMRCLIALLLTVLIVTPEVEAKTLPDKFLGTFKLERDENFDEYLKARGYGWIMRQITFDLKDPNTLTETHIKVDDPTDVETYEYRRDGDYLVMITFDLKDPNTLTETHIKVDDPTDVETYEYRRDGDYLVMMRCLIALLLTVLIVTPEVEAKTLPDKFLGTFKLERDENFDEYLKARGYGWLIRQVIELLSVTKKFSKAASGKPGRYDMENLTTEKDTHHKDWILGKEFQDEALDSTQHKAIHLQLF
uniref:FABP domain-containing protein n=1 Tax=Ascaris lumbricoides TaxID=6252 RepID=A0A0M3I9D6_ASCLU